MLHIWELHQNQNLQSHKQVHVYLKLNMELENMLQEYWEDMTFEPTVADKFEHTMTTMFLVLTGLAKYFVEETLFCITQKTHFLQHTSMLARYLSPRLTWCFTGEDLQKRISHLCKACLKGQKPSMSVLKLISLHRLGLHLQFTERALEE